MNVYAMGVREHVSNTRQRVCVPNARERVGNTLEHAHDCVYKAREHVHLGNTRENVHERNAREHVHERNAHEHVNVGNAREHVGNTCEHVDNGRECVCVRRHVNVYAYATRVNV